MKRIIAMLLAVVMVFALCACSNGGDNGGTDAKDDGKVSLDFVTGGEQGTYYAFGTVLAQQVSDKTSTSVTALSGNGSQANVEDIAGGNAQLGFVQSDVMSYAYNGEKLFTEKVTDFSVVAALYMEQVQIVTLNPDIKTVADLKGKTVSIGAKGSGVYFNALDLLGAYGLTENDIKPEYLNFGDSTDSLKDGKIDAAFVPRCSGPEHRQAGLPRLPRQGSHRQPDRFQPLLQGVHHLQGSLQYSRRRHHSCCRSSSHCSQRRFRGSYLQLCFRYLQ